MKWRCTLACGLLFLLSQGATTGWRVAELNGAPGLFLDDRPVAPIMFWQWEAEEQDMKALADAGVKLFGIFGSFGHYQNPYWGREGFCGMAYQDERLDHLLEWVPDAAFLPRIFAAAPQWWIDANPEEQIRYSNPRVLPPNWKSLSQSVPRESFASEKCRRELGTVYRQAVRHLHQRYGRHLLGIHLANGPWGENFAWDGLTQISATPLEHAGFSDVSRPMTERFRRYLRAKYGDVAHLREAWKDSAVSFDNAEVPTRTQRLSLDVDGVWRDPAKGRRVPDYFECMNAVTVEMLDHYGGIVKEETKLPVLAFYGYTQDEWWSIECDHRAISKMYRLKNVDMFSAPHTYHRRSPGEDGSMRCYLASAALHGKFFLDEGDDMTHLEQAKAHPDNRCSATNLFESVNLLYREFGMAVTHGVGLWYMDLKRDTFRDPELVAAVGRMRRAADLALKHDRSHRSEVAVVSNVESEFYMGYRRTEANRITEYLYQQQVGAFYRAGAPFDWYLAEDLDAVRARNYKVVVFLDCQYMTETQRRQVEALKCDGRTLVFFHAPGFVSQTGLSRTRMESVCGVKTKAETVRGVLSAVDVATGREWGCGLDHVIDGVGDRPRGVRHRVPGTTQLGLFLPAEGETLMTGVGNLVGTPVAVRKRQKGWTSVLSALPALAPDVLREIYKASGVHVYTDEDVVLSANSAWLMLHARKRGCYAVQLPRRVKLVRDVTSGAVVARDCDRFTCELEQFQTAVFLLGDDGGNGVTAYSMLTRDGRRMVSHVEGTNTVYELVPTNRLPANLPLLREWKLYGLKATHTDIGLHNPQYIQRHGTVKRIDAAARLIDADTRADDDPAAYRYVMEGFWFWDNYHQDKGMDAAWRIVTNYIARGRMDVGVTCAGNHTHLFSATEIERSTRTKKILAEKWGIGTKTFIMADNPGISCSVIAPYVRAGIRYGLFLPNQWNPIPSTIWKKNTSIVSATWNPDAMGGGARVEVSYDSPLPMVFRWKAPGRDESLLMWCSTQYGYGYSRLGIAYGKKGQATVERVEKRMPKFLEILEDKYPYDIWVASLYGDDEDANTAFADFAAAWNAKWAWPQFHTVGRLDEPFEYLEKNFSDKIPTLTGEMTSGWLQHAASTPELLADKLNADRMLETAERLGTFAGTIDRAAVDRAWWHLILNDEHSYGTSGYQGRRVFETWMQHRDWIERAAATASNELAKAVVKLTGTTDVSSVGNFNGQDVRCPSRVCRDGLTENRWYRVVVTNGVIHSIYDKELKRELLDGVANHFLYTRDNHKTWEIDPEAALGAQVTRRVFLVDDAKRIDIEDRFEHARDLFNSRRYYRYGYLAFPFAVPDGKFTAHLNGTVIRPYEDCHPMTTDAYCAVRDWCAVENSDFGVALMMRDSTLTEFGEIHPDKTCYTGKPPPGKTAIYPYLFTDWLQMHQPDGDSMNFVFRFAITSYAKDTRHAVNGQDVRCPSADWAEIERICEDWLNPYARWMRAHKVPRVVRNEVDEPPPGWTGLIEKPRAGHGEKDGQMYLLWGAEMSPEFSHYELYRDGKFLANVTNEVPDGIPYRVARYEDLGLPTHSRHEYRIRKVWKDGKIEACSEPFHGTTRYAREAERANVCGPEVQK